jgi:hypothetical protein
MPDKDRSSSSAFPMPVSKIGLCRGCDLLVLVCSSLMPDSGQLFIRIVGFFSHRGHSAVFSFRL